LDISKKTPAADHTISDCFRNEREYVTIKLKDIGGNEIDEKAPWCHPACSEEAKEGSCVNAVFEIFRCTLLHLQ
jgi:hypothetical protein